MTGARAGFGHRGTRWAALCLAGLILLAACGAPSVETPPAPTDAAVNVPTRPRLVIPTPPKGWTPYSRSNYQIALPDSWQEVKLTESDLTGAITTAQENNPPLAEQLRALLETGQYKSFIFYAVEKNSTTPENVSIARAALAGTGDLQTYAKSYADALPNLVRGAKLIEAQVLLHLNGMNAATFVYDVSLVDEGGNLTTLRGVQYLYVLDSGDAYLVTMTGKTDDVEKFTALARQIGTSFFAVTP